MKLLFAFTNAIVAHLVSRDKYVKKTKRIGCCIIAHKS